MGLDIAIPTGMKVIAGTMLGGALIGGGIGAVQSLREQPKDDGISRMEKRNVLANAIVGAGVGAAGGVALLGLRKFIPAIGGLPVVGSLSGVQALALGGATGAVSVGAYSAAKSLLD